MDPVEQAKRAVKGLFRAAGVEVQRSRAGDAHAFDRTFERLRAMRELGFRPRTVCDAGASSGSWTRRFLQDFPGASVFMVEPLAVHQSALATLAQASDRLSVWEGCLGGTPGTLTFNADGDGSSLLGGHEGNRYGTQEEVRVETLDSLVENGICPVPDLLKLDVQGYELEVLAGAAAALGTVQAVLAEVSFVRFQEGMPLFHELLAALAARGFVVHDIVALSQRPLDGALAQADVVFLREDHPLRASNRWSEDSVY